MPCPLTARSRFESVNSMLPCANCCATAATRTPLPLALLDTPCSDTANRSANSVREPLKPVVCGVGDVVGGDVQVRLARR